MIEAHIADGDYVVIRQQQTARDGEIVVALVEGQDATLKTFYKEKNRIRSNPRTPAEADLRHRCPDSGVLVGVIREC